MRWVGRPMVSWPLILTEPLREPIRPMMARMVEVRPAPLRPSKVTTAPGGTTRSTPCSTCDSPYQACKPLISSAGVLAMSVRSLQLTVGGAHVGFHDLGVTGNFFVAAFSQQRATLQHRDAVGNAGDDFHVVLHHQNGATGRDFFDQLGDAVHVFMAHALGGFIEQHQ